MELASASASAAASNVTTPQSPPPAAAHFLPASLPGAAGASVRPGLASSAPALEDSDTYCDPATAFSTPPIQRHENVNVANVTHVAPVATTPVNESKANGFANPLHPNFSAYQTPNNLPVGGAVGKPVASTEQHHFDPKALGIRPRNDHQGGGKRGIASIVLLNLSFSLSLTLTLTLTLTLPLSPSFSLSHPLSPPAQRIYGLRLIYILRFYDKINVFFYCFC